MDRDDWIQCRKVYGKAGQIASVAKNLIRQKGLGERRLAEPAFLEKEAKSHQNIVDDVLSQAKEQPSKDEWKKLDYLLSPLAPADPRIKDIIFKSAFQLQAAELLPSEADPEVLLAKLADVLKALGGGNTHR